ncbi:hypothetical protein, partial [Neisseria mucosa]|uniref:hypothetical protein n=1 Tax=Neisseria mucosa TaxID=488 RepID=UPI00197DA624
YKDAELIKSLYLSNSRNIIIEKSSNKDNRNITKEQFIEQLKSSETIIRNNILLLDENNYIKIMRKNIKYLLTLPGT